MRGSPQQVQQVQSTYYPSPQTYPKQHPLLPHYYPHYPPHSHRKQVPDTTPPPNNSHNIKDLSQDLQHLKEQLRQLTEKKTASPSKLQPQQSPNLFSEEIAARRHFSAQRLPDRRQVPTEVVRAGPPLLEMRKPLPASQTTSMPMVSPSEPALAQYSRPYQAPFRYDQKANQSKMELFKEAEVKGTVNTYQFDSQKQKVLASQGPRVAPFNNPNKRQNQLMGRPKTNSSKQNGSSAFLSGPATATNSSNQSEVEQARKERDQIKKILQIQKKLNSELRDKLTQQRVEHSPDKRVEQLAEKMKIQQEQSNAIILKLRGQIASLTQKKAEGSGVSFDEVLKRQLEEVTELRGKVERESEKAHMAKEKEQAALREVERLKNELASQEMRRSAELRGMEQRSSIQLNDVQNDYMTAKRTIEMLQGRNRVLVTEIREKDEFIMSFLVGRVGSEKQLQVQEVLQRYRLTFPEQRGVQQLLGSQRELQRLRGQNN